MLLQAALVFGPVGTVGAALLRVLAALDLQVVLHVPEPTVAFVAPRAAKATGPLVQAAGRPLGHPEARAVGRKGCLVLAHRSTVIIVTGPGLIWKQRKNNILSLEGGLRVDRFDPRVSSGPLGTCNG